jgi:hypothetical protein
VLAAFWSGLGGEFAKQWITRVLTPAFVFWAAGLAVVWWDGHAAGVRAHGWAAELTATTKPLQAVSGLGQGILLVGALLLLTASGLIAERLTLPLLRILEGYWTRPAWLWQALVSLWGWRRRRWSERVGKLRTAQRRGALSVPEYAELLRLEAAPPADAGRLALLRQRRAGGFTARDAAMLSRGLRVLRRVPEQESLRMPSQLGNLLRAAERRPIAKYGLDPAVCWTALWLVLPAETKTEITQSRTALDNATRVWLWSALFLVWTPWTWWAVPIGLLVPALAYYGGMLGAASLFGDLVVAAFDLHRMRLYDGLQLPRPQSPIQERREAGPRATNMLWGGLDEPGLGYTAAPNP